MKPATPVEHRKVSDAIGDRLTRAWKVYSRIADECYELSVLGLIHYVLGAVPNAEYIGLSMTDQGGESMTFDCIGVEDKNYLAWQRERGYLTDGLDSELRDWTGEWYVEIAYDHPVINDLDDDGSVILSEDALTDYAMSLNDHQLGPESWFERTGNRHSGTGRLWIAKALLALQNTYEGFIGEALDPFPDPSDAQAVAAWLARETAPEDEPLCGCGARHAIHADDED